LKEAFYVLPRPQDYGPQLDARMLRVYILVQIEGISTKQKLTNEIIASFQFQKSQSHVQLRWRSL
jgi:hypothetical protein